VYIIVVGGGQVGYYLSKALLAEGHEILVLEKDRAKCDRINDELGSICMRGDGCEASILKEAGTGRADMLIAVTDGDEDNLVACQVARHMFNVSRTIARLSNPKNEVIFKKLGIDCTISSTDLILEHIESEVPTHPLMHLLKLRESNMEIVEIRISRGSPAVGKRFGDLKLPTDSMLVLLLRHGQRPQALRTDTILEADDQVLAVTKSDQEEALRAVFSGKPAKTG